jgi:hypothetical protein
MAIGKYRLYPALYVSPWDVLSHGIHCYYSMDSEALRIGDHRSTLMINNKFNFKSKNKCKNRRVLNFGCSYDVNK